LSSGYLWVCQGGGGGVNLPEWEADHTHKVRCLQAFSWRGV